MKLVSKKIYRAGVYTHGTPLPSLEYKGSPKVYISLATYKPKLEDMTEITGEIEQGINLLQGQFRWIAVVYEDKTDSVSECGIVTSIADSTEA